MLKYLFTLAGVTSIPDESNDVELSFLEWVESSPYNGILVGVVSATLTFAVILSLYLHFKSDVSGQRCSLDGKKNKGGLGRNVNNHDKKERLFSRASTSGKDSKYPVKSTWTQARKGREPWSISSELSRSTDGPTFRPTDGPNSSRQLREKLRRIQISCHGDSISPQTRDPKSIPVFERQASDLPPINGEDSLIVDDICETASMDDVFLSPTEINVVKAEPNGTIVDSDLIQRRVDTRHPAMAGNSKTDMTEPWSTTNPNEPKIECVDNKVWKLTIPKEENFKVNITCHRLSSPARKIRACALTQQSVQTYTPASLVMLNTALTQTDSGGSASPCTCRHDTGMQLRTGKYWPCYSLKKHDALPKDCDKSILSGTDSESCHVRPIQTIAPRQQRCTCPNKQLVSCSLNSATGESILWPRHAYKDTSGAYHGSSHNSSSASSIPVRRQASGNKVRRKQEINETDNHIDSKALRSSYLENLWEDAGYSNEGESDENTEKNEMTLGEDNTLTKVEDNGSCSSSWSAVEEVEKQALCIIDPDSPSRRGAHNPITICPKHQKVSGALKKTSKSASSTLAIKPMFKTPEQEKAKLGETRCKIKTVPGSIRMKNSHIPKVFQRGRPLKAAIYSQSRSLSYCHRNRIDRGEQVRSSWGHQLQELTSGQAIEMEHLNQALVERPFTISGSTAGNSANKPDSNPYGKTGNAVLSSTSCDVSDTIRQNVNTKQSEEQMRITFRQCSAVKQAIQPVPTFTLQTSELMHHKNNNWLVEADRGSNSGLYGRVRGGQTMNIHESTDELRKIMQYTTRDMQRYKPTQSSVNTVAGSRENAVLGTSHEKKTGVAKESRQVFGEIRKRLDVSDTDDMNLNKVTEMVSNGIFIELKNMTANSCNHEEGTGVTSDGNLEHHSSSSSTAFRVNSKRMGVRSTGRGDQKRGFKDGAEQQKVGTQNGINFLKNALNMSSTSHTQRGCSGHDNLRISSGNEKKGAALLVSGRGDSVNNSHDVSDCKLPLTQAQSPGRQKKSSKKKGKQPSVLTIDKLKIGKKQDRKKRRPAAIILDIQTNESASCVDSDPFKKSVPLLVRKEINKSVSDASMVPKKSHPGKCMSSIQRSSFSTINPLATMLGTPMDNVIETSKERSFQTFCVETNRFDSASSTTSSDQTGRNNTTCLWTDTKHLVFGLRPSNYECVMAAPGLMSMEEYYIGSVSNEDGSKKNYDFYSDNSTSTKIDAILPLNMQHPHGERVTRNTTEMPESTYSRWSSTEISHVTMEFVGVDTEGRGRRNYEECRKFDTRQPLNKISHVEDVVDHFTGYGQGYWTLSREDMYSSDNTNLLSDANVSSTQDSFLLKGVATRRIRRHCDPRSKGRRGTRYRDNLKEIRGDFPEENGLWKFKGGRSDTWSSEMMPFLPEPVMFQENVEEYEYDDQRKDSDLSWYLSGTVVRASSTDTVNAVAGIEIRSPSHGDLSYDLLYSPSDNPSDACQDGLKSRLAPRRSLTGTYTAGACHPYSINKRKRSGERPISDNSKYRRYQYGEELVTSFEKKPYHKISDSRFPGHCSFGVDEKSLPSCEKTRVSCTQQRSRQLHFVNGSSLRKPNKKRHQLAARSQGKVGLKGANRVFISSESAQTLTTFENSTLLSDEMRTGGEQSPCRVDRARVNSSRLVKKRTPQKIHLEATISHPSVLFDTEQISYMEIVPKYGTCNGLRLSQLDDPQVAHLFPHSRRVMKETHLGAYKDVKDHSRKLSSPSSPSEPEILYKLVVLSSDSTEGESETESHSVDTSHESTEANPSKGLHEIPRSIQVKPAIDDVLTYMYSPKISTKQQPVMTGHGQCDEPNRQPRSFLKKCLSDTDATKETEEICLIPRQLDKIPVGSPLSPKGNAFKSPTMHLMDMSGAKENKRSISCLYPIRENSREKCMTKYHAPEEAHSMKMSDLNTKLAKLASHQEFIVANVSLPVQDGNMKCNKVAVPGYADLKKPDPTKEAGHVNSLKVGATGKHVTSHHDNVMDTPKVTLAAKQRAGGKVDKMSQCQCFNRDAVTELNGLLAYFSNGSRNKCTQVKMRDAKITSSVQDSKQQFSWTQVQKDKSVCVQISESQICQQPQGTEQTSVGNCEVEVSREAARNAVEQTYPIFDSRDKIFIYSQQDEGVQTEITKPMRRWQSPESQRRASLKHLDDLGPISKDGKDRRQQSYRKLYDGGEPFTRVEIIEMKNKERVQEINVVNREEDFIHRKEENTAILRRNVTKAECEESKCLRGYNDTRTYDNGVVRQQRPNSKSHFCHGAKCRRLRNDFLSEREGGVERRENGKNAQRHIGDACGEGKTFGEGKKWGEETIFGEGKTFAHKLGAVVDDQLEITGLQNYEKGKIILETYQRDDYKDVRHYYYHKKPESPGLDTSPDKSIQIFQLSEYHRTGGAVENAALVVKPETCDDVKETSGLGQMKTWARHSVSDQKLLVEKSEAVARSSSSDNLLRNKRRTRPPCFKNSRKGNSTIIPPGLISHRKELERIVKDSTHQLDVANKEIKIHINFNMGNSACSVDVLKPGRRRRDGNLSHTSKSPPKKSYLEKTRQKLDVQRKSGHTIHDDQEKNSGQRKLGGHEKKSGQRKLDVKDKKSGQRKLEAEEKKSGHPKCDVQEKIPSSRKKYHVRPNTHTDGKLGESDLKHTRKGKCHNPCCQHIKKSPQKTIKEAQQLVETRETKRKKKVGQVNKQINLEKGVEVIGPSIEEDPPREKSAIRHLSYHCSESEGQLMGGRNGSTLANGHVAPDAPLKNREQSQLSTGPADTLREASSNKTTSGARDPNELNRKTDIYNTLLSALLLALSGPKLGNESFTDREEPRSSISERNHTKVCNTNKLTIPKDTRHHKEDSPTSRNRFVPGKCNRRKSKIPVPMRFTVASGMAQQLASNLRPPRGQIGSKQNNSFKNGPKTTFRKDGFGSFNAKLSSLRFQQKILDSKITQQNRASVYARPATRPRSLFSKGREKNVPKVSLKMKGSNSPTIKLIAKSRLPQGIGAKSQGNVQPEDRSGGDGDDVRAANRAVHFEAAAAQDEDAERTQEDTLMEHLVLNKSTCKLQPTSPPKPSSGPAKPIRPTGSLQHVRKSFKPFAGHPSRQLGDELQTKQHETSKPERETPVLLHEQFFYIQQRPSTKSNLESHGGLKMIAIQRDDPRVTDATHCETLLKAAVTARHDNGGTTRVANNKRFRGGRKTQASRFVDKNVTYGGAVIKNEDLVKMPVRSLKTSQAKPSMTLTATQQTFQHYPTKNLHKESDKKRAELENKPQTFENTTALQHTPSNSQDQNVPEDSLREKRGVSPVFRRHSSPTPQTTKTSSPLPCPSSSISIVLDTTDDVSASILCENLSPDQQVNYTRRSPTLFKAKVDAPRKRDILKASKRFKTGTPRLQSPARQQKDTKRF